MKVIGAGLGRTGTLSLKVALEQLGFGPCYHMKEVLQHPEHIETWLEAFAEKPVDWQAFFHAYGAAVDRPSCEFYKELMAVYPEAKVVLTVRDPVRWYESTYNTLYTISQAFPRWFRFLIPRIMRFVDLNGTEVWRTQFSGRFEDQHHAIGIFQQHTEAVKAYVPPERLLVYNVKDGWEPLCQFLEVPVPANQPFPHLNDSAEFRRTIRLLQLSNWLMPLLLGLLTLLGGTIIVYS